jgi:HK97 family phage portal protein
MLLDQGMTYEAIKPLTLQDVDARELKKQTMTRICGLFGVPPAMIGVGESKYNNTQTMLDEFYKSTMMPFITNVEQRLKLSLLKGFPNLHVQFQTQDFLKGAPLDQMNYVVAGVKNGILTQNEAREYLGLNSLDGADDLLLAAGGDSAIPGSSPQDTGGGGNLKVVGKTGRAGNA